MNCWKRVFLEYLTNIGSRVMRRRFSKTKLPANTGDLTYRQSINETINKL